LILQNLDNDNCDVPYFDIILPKLTNVQITGFQGTPLANVPRLINFDKPCLNHPITGAQVCNDVGNKMYVVLPLTASLSSDTPTFVSELYFQYLVLSTYTRDTTSIGVVGGCKYPLTSTPISSWTGTVEIPIIPQTELRVNLNSIKTTLLNFNRYYLNIPPATSTSEFHSCILDLSPYMCPLKQTLRESIVQRYFIRR
jgi:hypothetical protein